MNLLFCSGLPRSGSTLLLNLLAQNPKFHCTPTSDLIELFVAIRDKWMGCEAFKAQGLKEVEPRVASSMRGLLYGFFHDELVESGKTVIDKSRGWPAYIEVLEQVLGRKVQIICTVRDLRDVCASLEKIHRKSRLTQHPISPVVYVESQTVEGRVKQLFSADAMLGMSVNRIKDAFERGLSDRLLIVPYNDLTSDPKTTLARLHFNLGIEPFDYDTTNAKQLTHEDDTVYGMDLHTIRPHVEENNETWHGILPEDVAQWINESHPGIQKLAGVLSEDDHGEYEYVRSLTLEKIMKQRRGVQGSMQTGIPPQIQELINRATGITDEQQREKGEENISLAGR